MPLFDRGKEVREQLDAIYKLLQSIEAKIGSDVQNLYGVKVDISRAVQEYEGYLLRSRDDLERGISQLNEAIRTYGALVEGSKSFQEELANLHNVFEQIGGGVERMEKLAEALTTEYEKLSSQIHTLSTLIRPDVFNDILNKANEIIQKAEELRLEQRTSFYQQKMQNLLEVVKNETEKAADVQREAEKTAKTLEEVRDKLRDARKEYASVAEKVKGAKAELEALQRKIAELEERRRLTERSLREEAARFTAELGEVRNKLDAYLDLLKLRYEELIDLYKQLDPEKARELIQKAAEL
jgi:DNA repair exonuclease SbcCD ATPase subunit